MTIVSNFFNKVASELDAKYFPEVKYYRDNDRCAAVHYQTELFNNGCLRYTTYINRVAKLCNATRNDIRGIVGKHVTFLN
jgi:hypothetical protein